MDLTQLIGTYPVASVALLGFATIGAVKLVRSLFKKQYEAAAIIVVSALLPAALAGFVDGIAPLVGAVIGLGAAGVITTSSRLAGTDEQTKK